MSCLAYTYSSLNKIKLKSLLNSELKHIKVQSMRESERRRQKDSKYS